MFCFDDGLCSGFSVSVGGGPGEVEGDAGIGREAGSGSDLDAMVS